MNVGGNMFQTFGAMGNYFQNRGNGTTADLGRYNVTRLEPDRHVFKVPSLRNVALTAPYFHDGTAKTLEEAVDVMFKYQLGRSAPKEDKEQIVEFLKTLTGQVPGQIGVQPNGAMAALK
jgi:cytochrome c peroxidase